MIPYRCQTCGETLTLSADGWAWHRLVEHPRMGLPVHDPARTRREPAWVNRARENRLPAKVLA